MHDEEGHLRERRIDTDKVVQMLIGRGKTECKNCPWFGIDDCGTRFAKFFHVNCCEIDATQIEII